MSFLLAKLKNCESDFIGDYNGNECGEIDAGKVKVLMSMKMMVGKVLCMECCVVEISIAIKEGRRRLTLYD